MDCLSKERFVLDIIENKLDAGIERALNALCSWLKLNLPTGQKHSDSKALDKANMSVRFVSGRRCYSHWHLLAIAAPVPD